MADYNLVKCYVLLHDLTSGPANSQAAADGLQVAACSAPRGGERSAARMPCAPRAASVASAPQAAARRPPRGHSGPRCSFSPTLPPLSIAASLHLPQEISRAYGPDACKVLPINSRAAGAPPLPDLWTGARPPEFNPSAEAPPPPTEELGALLSDADMEQARNPAPDPPTLALDPRP